MLTKLQIGASGLLSSAIATPLLISEPKEGVINAIVQVVIAVVTLLGLFKKKK